MATRNSGRRGFASMDPEERRQIARRGGQASHGGRGYQDDYEEDYDEEYTRFYPQTTRFECF